VVKQVENYDAIEGSWLTNENNYLVIHRLVVDKELKGKGLAASILK
jgi:predicted GNAT family acetyltransferase